MLVFSKITRLVSVLLLLTSANAYAQTSIADILSSVEKSNLRLQSLKHSNEADVLDLRADNALAGPAVEYSPFYSKDYSGVASSELIISEEIDFPTKYANRRKQADLKSEILDKEYAAARRDILLEAELLCLDIIRSNKVNALLRQRMERAETVIALYDKKMKAGDADILTYNKAKMEKMTVANAQAEAESEQQELLRALQTLNGGKSITLTATDFPERTIDIDFPTFMQHSLSINPDILAAQSNVKASEHDVASSRQSWLPSIKAGYRRNTAEREAQNGFMVGASFPLFSTSSAVKAAKQRQLSAQLALDDSRQQAEAELRSRYDELLHLRKSMDKMDNTLLTETLFLLDKALNYGQINALEYYTEIDNIYSTLQSNIDLQHRYHKLLATLYKDEL